MALTFPIPQATLGDLLPIASVTWQPKWQQEITGLGSGEILTSDLAPPLWEASVTLRPRLHSEARRLLALLTALGGSTEAMYLANPLGWWPAADPGGTLFGPWTAKIKAINADRKQVSFKNLVAGSVISTGDFFALDYGTPSRRALIQIIGGGVANGSGETDELEVRPHLRAGIGAEANVTFAKPAAKGKILPDTLQVQQHSTNRTRISFAFRQTLQAG